MISTGQSTSFRADLVELHQLLASGSSGSPIDLDATFFMMLGIFPSMFWYLNRTLFQPYFTMQDARIERTDNARVSARDMQGRAEEVLERYESQMVEARTTASEARAAVRKSAKEREVEILTAARTEISLIMGRARDELDAEVDAAASEFQKQSDDLSNLIAERVLVQ